jgi:hypothetical protein
VLTKEALPKRNADGMKPGRPVGGAKKLRLDPMASMFDDNLAKGIDKRSIAKQLGAPPGTIYARPKVRLTEANPAVSDSK